MPYTVSKLSFLEAMRMTGVWIVDFNIVYTVKKNKFCHFSKLLKKYLIVIKTSNKHISITLLVIYLVKRYEVEKSATMTVSPESQLWQLGTAVI